ncbi:MAG: DUF1232 domain-containing protein [Clostridia bacterium]|nr:DUF1232 domain-containing protein [Clostridia bacterium]
MKTKKWMDRIKAFAHMMKSKIDVLIIASQRHDVGFFVKLLLILVVGYALSPIDLIPDFISVLGYLDDLILLPLGIALAIKLIPDDILAECEALSRRSKSESRSKNYVAGIVIVLIWVGLFILIIRKLAGY